MSAEEERARSPRGNGALRFPPPRGAAGVGQGRDDTVLGAPPPFALSPRDLFPLLAASEAPRSPTVQASFPAEPEPSLALGGIPWGCREPQDGDGETGK